MGVNYNLLAVLHHRNIANVLESLRGRSVWDLGLGKSAHVHRREARVVGRKWVGCKRCRAGQTSRQLLLRLREKADTKFDSGEKNKKLSRLFSFSSSTQYVISFLALAEERKHFYSQLSRGKRENSFILKVS